MRLALLIALHFAMPATLLAQVGPTASGQVSFSRVQADTNCNGWTMSTTPQAVANGNYTTTQVNPSSATVFSLFVENEDSSINVCCSQNSGVTCTGSTRGKRITPGSWASWLIPFWKKWYCVAASGTPNIQVCTTR